MLKLRPNCECCNRDLPADSAEAFICSFECTFCRSCAREVLGGCAAGVSSYRGLAVPWTSS